MKLRDYPFKHVPVRILRDQPGSATIIVLWAFAIVLIHLTLVILSGDKLKQTTTKWASSAQVSKERNSWQVEEHTSLKKER